MMNLKSLFLPKELWSCNHPKTESFRATPRRNARSAYQASMDLGNRMELDSPGGWTWLNSEDAVPELPLDGMVRGLCSDRLFFEPNCTKFLATEEERENVKATGGATSSATSGNREQRVIDLETDIEDMFLPLMKENVKIVATGFEMGADKDAKKEDDTKRSDFEVEPNVISDGFPSPKLVGALTIKTHVSDRVSKLKDHGEAEKTHHNLPLEEDVAVNTLDGVFQRNWKDGQIDGNDSVRGGRPRGDEKMHSCSVSIENNAKASNDAESEEEEKKDRSQLSLPVEESLIIVMDSTNPYLDFMASMEEMVEVFGLDEWSRLEEMLLWYLRVNGTRNHGYILGAFVDLLVWIVTSSRN